MELRMALASQQQGKGELHFRAMKTGVQKWDLSQTQKEHNQCRPLLQPHETKNKETGESQGKLLENSEIIDLF